MESKAKHRSGQGRPPGLLLAWLASAHEYEAAFDPVHGELPAIEARLFHRNWNRATPGVQYLMENAERPPRPDEGEEPDVVP